MYRWIAFVFICASALSCGTDFEPKELGEPCTRDEQCVQPMRCLSGVCSDADAGV